MNADTEANQTLIGEFTIKGDVKILSKLRDYDGAHGYDASIGEDLSTVSKRVFGALLKPQVERLNIIYLT